MDEKIKKDVVDQLFWDGRVDASGIRVDVSDGEVSLSGDVISFSASQAAENDAMSIPGVRTVKNFLRITRPDITPVPGDEEIKKSIESVLKWNPYIEDAEIDIVVEEGIVRLKGTVDSPWKKDRIGRIAYDIFGVVEVINQLGVVPTRNIVDQVIAEDIAAAFERNVNIDADDIDVKVEDGNVVLSGSLPNWSAFRAAYETALHTEGVVSVVNDLSVSHS